MTSKLPGCIMLSLVIVLTAWTPSPRPPHPMLEWSEGAPINGAIYYPLIVHDTLYFTNRGMDPRGYEATPIVAAFNLTTRQLLWHIERKPLIPMTSDGERLFIFTDTGIEALSVRDGSTVWQREMHREDERVDELLAKDELLFYSAQQSDNVTLNALNAETGATAWTTLLPGLGINTPNLCCYPEDQWEEYRVLHYDRGQLFVRLELEFRDNPRHNNPLYEDSLYEPYGVAKIAWIALTAKGGQRLWEFPFECTAEVEIGLPTLSRPAFDEQHVYFGGCDSKDYALDRKTGNPVWVRERSRGTAIERPVYVPDQIIGITDDESVGSLDSQTGDLRWTVPIVDDDLGTSSPFVFLNGYLIFFAQGSEKRQLSVVDLQSGERVFTSEPSFPPPFTDPFPSAMVLHNGHLYLVSPNSIHCFMLEQ